MTLAAALAAAAHTVANATCNLLGGADPALAEFPFLAGVLAEAPGPVDAPALDRVWAAAALEDDARELLPRARSSV